jgi:uncharacterized protein YgbK (DUF1537 family)
MRLLIVADDLTGALDSAAALASAGLRCVVARRPHDIVAALERRPDVLAVSTASRETTAGAAAEAVAAVFDRIAHVPALVFKKVDSRLKGHCGIELGVVAARTGIRHAIATPAVPAQGRITAGGRLAGFGVAEPVDVAAVLAGSGVALTVPDARTDADLDRIVADAMTDVPPLFVGAAGLAAALGRRICETGKVRVPAPLERPLMLAIGSHDPITLAQVDALRTFGIGALEAPDGKIPVPIDGDVSLVRLVPGGAHFDPTRAGARFAASVAEAAGARLRTLFACGGETADAILGRMGAGILEVEGEVLPGMPASTMLAHGRELRLVTKSGGFGAPDSLVALVDGSAGRIAYHRGSSR